MTRVLRRLFARRPGTAYLGGQQEVGLAKNSGAGYTVGKSPSGSKSTFKGVGSGKDSVRVMSGAAYKQASSAANTAIRSVTSGKFVTTSSAKLHAATTLSGKKR